MRSVMSVQVSRTKGLLWFLMGALAAASAAPEAAAQAVLIERLANGTQLVVVSQPLADATTVAWPVVGTDGEVAVSDLVAGRLTLTADLEAALGGLPESAAPPVVVAVGGASPSELGELAARLLGDRRPVAVPRLEAEPVIEGGLDRQLGPPGSDAQLRLIVPLPPPGDPRRSSVEVLWELVPSLLPSTVPRLESRIDGDRALLEGPVDAELAELHVREIRFALARFAFDPRLEEGDVADARARHEVQRHAALEEHPEAAKWILARWRSGGEPAVREVLFGLRGVTLESVRSAAAEWLPDHPGRARLTLPPRVFNPRFAVGPQPINLANDLAAAVLERRAATMSVVCLRPVLVPDLDGSVTATVLARVARELRTSERRPGWIRVRQAPPLLEVAAPADAFGELLEQLARARSTVAEDNASVVAGGADASRRALALMADRLAISRVESPTPASLLRPGNLALGVVAVDGEAAAEALAKFWGGSSAGVRTTLVDTVPAGSRSRVAAPGDESVVVIALELAFGGADATRLVTAELLEARLRQLLPETRSRALRPFVPGRSLLVLEVAASGTVDEVEAMVRRIWPTLTAGVDDDELAPIRRRAAADASAAMSGVAGHARHAAAAAAGAVAWRQPAELELEILSLEAVAVTATLEGFAAFDELETTAAGELPIDRLGDR
jgi:hypothetical protein